MGHREILALTYPKRKMPPSAESGKRAKAARVGLAITGPIGELLSVARFWLFYPSLIAYLLGIGVHRLFAFLLQSACLFQTVVLLSFAYLHLTAS
jgi:hypothetical protein